MKFTDSGIALLKEFEGCAFVAYPDPGTGGVPWTIGYGHTRGVTQGMTCTQQQADEWLKEDVEAFSKEVTDRLTSKLNDNQFSAFVCFAFNVKSWRASTVLEFLNDGNFDEACEHWVLYCKANGKPMDGLLRRRRAEVELFKLSYNSEARVSQLTV